MPSRITKYDLGKHLLLKNKNIYERFANFLLTRFVSMLPLWSAFFLNAETFRIVIAGGDFNIIKNVIFESLGACRANRGFTPCAQECTHHADKREERRRNKGGAVGKTARRAPQVKQGPKGPRPAPGAKPRRQTSVESGASELSLDPEGARPKPFSVCRGSRSRPTMPT